MRRNTYNLTCGCTPDASGYGYCNKCVADLRKKIWNNMSSKQKAYDRKFAPKLSAKYDDGYFDDDCSCHIHAPCDYCIQKSKHQFAD